MFQKLSYSDKLCDEVFKKSYNEKHYNYLFSNKPSSNLFKMMYNIKIKKLFDSKDYYFIEEIIFDYIQTQKIFINNIKEIDIDSKYFTGLYKDIDNMIEKTNNNEEKNNFKMIKNRIYNIIQSYNLE